MDLRLDLREALLRSFSDSTSAWVLWMEFHLEPAEEGDKARVARELLGVFLNKSEAIEAGNREAHESFGQYHVSSDHDKFDDLREMVWFEVESSFWYRGEINPEIRLRRTEVSALVDLILDL